MMRLRCSQAERWISIRLDREPLPPGAEIRLDEHLRACAACRDLLREETGRVALLDAAASAPSGSERPELLEEILGKAMAGLPPGGASRSAPDRADRSRFASPGFWALAASLLLAAGGGLWLGYAERPAIPGEDVAASEGGTAPPVARVAGGSRDAGFLLVETRRSESDVLDTERGEPVGREVQRSRWVYSPVERDPGPGGKPEVILELERVDTRYLKPTSWH